MEINKQEQVKNLLPFDGTALYFGRIMPPLESDNYYCRLLKKVAWKNDEAVIFGKHFVTKRKVAWYGDQEYFYGYSNTTKKALPWISELEEIRSMVTSSTGECFNSCLLNLYHTGDEGMAWHSDDEKSLALNSSIASISFGAERKFSFRHRKTKETISLLLENGSLLLMKDPTQKNWMHSLPKTTKVKTPRINLTFRTMT